MADKKEVSSFNFRPSHKLTKINELLSYAFIDLLKLLCFDLHSLKRPRASTYVIQIGRIRKQRDRDAKKAAQGANKLRMKQRRAQTKEGELPLQY
jgi:hypothetical protein